MLTAVNVDEVRTRQEGPEMKESAGVKEFSREVNKKGVGDGQLVGEGEKKAGRAAQQRDGLRAKERDGGGRRASDPGDVEEEGVQKAGQAVDEVGGSKGGDGGDGVLSEDGTHPLPAGDDSRGGVEDEETG